MEKELLEILDKARQSGASKEQLQGIVDAYKLKKKDSPQPYQPTSEEPTEVSKTDSEGIDLGVYPTAFTPEEDIEAVKTSSKAKGYGLQDEEITKGRQAGFVLEKVDELIKDIDDFNIESRGSDEWGPRAFTQEDGVVKSPEYDRVQRSKEAVGIYGDDIGSFTQSKLQEAKPELDKRYQELSGYDREEFIVEQPDGSLAIDPNALTEVQFFSDQFAQAHKEEVAKQEERYREKGRLGRGAGLVGQGFENLYYGVEGWFDPEDAAANTAFTGAKLEGAKRAMGLSEEEIQGGVIKNIGDGKVGSALTNLYAGVMSNIPQIAVGVASSYVGMPNVGMATLGASAGGAKYAQIYDNPNIPTSAKYLMAAQVVVTETLTERLAMGDINAAKAAVRGLSKAGRKELALRTAKNFIQEAKIPLKVGTEEAIEEGIAGGAEALMDNLVTGEPIDMYSIGDAMAIGFASGSGIGSAKVLTSMPSYVGSYKTANRRRKVLDSLTKLREAQNDPNVTQEEIDILQKSVDDAKLELVKIATEDQQLYDKMSNEDVESIIKINRQIARGLDKLETISNDRAKSALKSQLQNLHKEKGNIEGKYRVEQAPVEQAEGVENTVRTFAERIAKGEDVSSTEDIQFYENNKQEVEDALRQIRDAESTKEQPVQDVERKNKIREQAKKEIDNVLDDDSLTEQQKEERIKSIVDSAKAQMSADKIQINFSVPVFKINGEIESGFKKSLQELGYSDSDISNMSFEQQQDIVVNKIEKADVADSSPIDVNKVAERLDRIAELQRSLDDEFLQEQPTEEQPTEMEGEAVVEEDLGFDIKEGDLGYHGGNLKYKAEGFGNVMKGTDVPFTGYYFYSSADDAKSRGNRQTGAKEFMAVDFSKYNLFKPKHSSEYFSVLSALKRLPITDNLDFLNEGYDKLLRKLRESQSYGAVSDDIVNLFETNRDNIIDAISQHSAVVDERLTRPKDNSDVVDTQETIALKALGFEGIDVRNIEVLMGDANPDSDYYGSVIFDLKEDSVISPKAKPKQETDAIQEQAAGEVPVQPEAEVSGEMEEGVPDTEPQEATQEGEGEKVNKSASEERREKRDTIKKKIDDAVTSKLPFLAKFNPEHSYTVAQAELIDKFIDEYVKTGSLKGSGNVEALINGVSNMASLKQKAKTGVRKIFFGNSFDAKALSLMREMSGKTFISKIFATGFEKVTSAIGMIELDEGLSSLKRDSSNWINKVKKDVNAADTSDVDSRGDVKMFAVGFVEQIYQRFSKDVGEERAIQLGIRMLELSIETQFNTKINREKINIQREALELIKNETTIEGILSKLTDGQRAVYEKVIEQNSQDIDKIEEISMSNGNPLERQNRYLHIPTITVDTGKNKLDLTPEEFSKDPNAIGYINPFNDKIFEITSGAQEARVKDINNLLKSFESGSVYLKPSFILEQHNSFFNTRLAIYTHKAIMQLNAALGAKESYEVFGGVENSGAENIDALKSIIKNNLNVNRISAYTLDVLPVVGNVVSSIKRNAISLALGSVVQPIKQGTVIATTIVEVGDLVGRSEAKDLFVRSMTFVYDYGGEKIRSKKEADDFQFKNLPWGKLISKAPVSVRNTLDALEFRDQLRNITIISSFAPARTARGGFRKIRDYSLSKSLVTPDRASAQVGWLNLYEAYMIKNGLLDTNIFYDKNGDFMSDAYRQWYIEQGNNPNNDAIAYASTRVLEYQGPSTEFERSMLQGNVNLNNEALNFIAKYTKDILLAMQSFSFGTSSTQTSAIVQLLGNNFTKEDKAKARVRLGGIAVSFALFNAIGLLVYDPLIAIAIEIIKDAREYLNLGDDEEEEYELNEKIKTLYKNPEDFRRALSRSLTNWTLESTVPFLSQGNAGKYALATGMDFIYYSIMNGIYGEEMKKTYGEFGIEGGFTVWQQSSQMRPQAYKPKDGFDLGYYTILPEDAYELYKVFDAGITGEYVDNYDNTYYLTEEQRKEALRIGGFMSFGYAVPAFPATTSKMGVDMFRGIVYEASDNYLATWSEDFKALPDDRKKELQEDFARNLNKYYQEQYKQILAEYGDEYISSLKVVNEVVYDLNDYSFTSQLKHLFAAMDGKEKASEGNIDAFLFNLSNRNITPIAKGNIINQRLKKFDDKKERNEYYGRFVYSGLFLYNMDELRAIMNHVAKLNEGGNDSK